MTTYPSERTRVLRMAGAVGMALVCAVAGVAAPPLNPLPRPYYSFDLESPAVVGGMVGAGDILTLGPGEMPVVVVPGPNIGLNSPADDLDALSSGHRLWPIGQSFAILFSVDRDTVGVALPDPVLVAAGVPFNVADQVARGHAAGDQFMGLPVFTLSPPRADDRGGRGTNNTQVGNNYDEGGTSFGGAPPTSSTDVIPAASEDDLDATSSAVAAERTLTGVYFALTADSPSLLPLSAGGQPSGANIFFNPAPMDFVPTQVYARFHHLQLTANDDIDGLIVFDFNADGVYNTGDIVLFSLTPNSPRLNTIPGHSSVGAAADVFIARPGFTTTTFAQAALFGLGEPADNIDALEILPCQDGYACAHEYGIRLRRGDLDCDGDIDFYDIDAFVLALSGPDAYQPAFPWCFWNAADTNCNGTVDFFDIDPFVACLTGNCPCP